MQRLKLWNLLQIVNWSQILNGKKKKKWEVCDLDDPSMYIYCEGTFGLLLILNPIP